MADDRLSQHRIQQLERQVEDLPRDRQQVALLKERVRELRDDMNKVADKLEVELGRIRRGLWLAAATFASMTVGILTLVVRGTG